MRTIELKSDLHNLLDKINNEHLLQSLYEFLKEQENSTAGQIWNSLSEQQKKEVYQSYEESEQEQNLKSWEDIKKKY